MNQRVILGAVVIGWPLSAMAASQNFYWYGDVNGNWTGITGSNSNWSLRSTTNQNTSNMPDGDDAVIFCMDGASRTSITVAGTPTIDSLAFNSYATSSFTIQSSTITLNAAGGTGLRVDAGSGSHTITSGLNLASNQSFEIQTPATPGANKLLISGKISGTGRQLTKTGGGILELNNGANDYSGGTNISEGHLRLSNASNTSAIGSGAVLIDTQGTLGGNGSLSGSVDVKGAIAPGASIGTLHTGPQKWFTGGSYQFEINAPTGAPGSNWDLLDINGALDLTSAAGFSIKLLSVDNVGHPAALAGFEKTLARSWVIAQTQGITNFTPGLLSVDASGLPNDLGGGSFGIGVEGNNLLLEYAPVTAVPEPSGLLSVAGVLIGLSRRKKTADVIKRQPRAMGSDPGSTYLWEVGLRG